MRRRTYLVTAAAATAGIAGCTGSEDPDEQGNETTEEEETEAPETEAPETEEEEEEDEEEEEEKTEEEDDEDDEGEKDDKTGTYDDFEDLSNWTVVDGHLSADEDRSYVGSQSGLLKAEKEQTHVSIALEFDSPRDFSDVIPGIALTAEEMVVPTIQLIDSSGDRIDFRRAVKANLPFMRYNFGVDEVYGDPDLSDVSEIRVVLWAGDEEARHFWCDDLHMTPRPDTGKVMIQFDDAHETDYTEGLPVLEEYGFDAVSFVNPGRIGNDGRLSLKQLEGLKDAGWTIGSHSHTHPELTQLSKAEQEAEIVESKEWLVENGFEEGAQYFAYPFGDYDETTLDLVEKHHDLGFGGGYPVQGYNTNPLLCTRLGDPEFDRAEEMLDRTAEMRGITSLFYHRLEDDGLENFKMTMKYLHDLERAGKIEVITPQDLESEYLF
ncbi:polysaccharide deacetylase family protein [Halobacteria archaeon AArc-m2/3/4]|uniref:Polysaccharide deacetylase family protein n=1 Tax=Natronoglomus mannanivorans TaxID=2979990 RepID=A0AAP2Z0M3_9EURY|nr:polysaccharide deacetylase family protein [Halobacteria archaeon AArc-xg1-1]MCU4974204.1 polysaccharide deacetylase family protein [Halobacteria archaeon AArc-m2/3/4]